MNRRGFLKAVGAVAACAALPVTALAARKSPWDAKALPAPQSDDALFGAAAGGGKMPRVTPRTYGLRMIVTEEGQAEVDWVDVKPRLKSARLEGVYVNLRPGDVMSGMWLKGCTVVLRDNTHVRGCTLEDCTVVEAATVGASVTWCDFIQGDG